MSEKLTNALDAIAEVVSQVEEKRTLKNLRIERQRALLEKSDELATSIFESYFAIVEGYNLSRKKACYVVTTMEDAIKTNQNIQLIETYDMHRKKIGNPSWESDLPGDETACWCPLSVLCTDDAFILLEKLADIRQVSQVILDKKKEVTDKKMMSDTLDEIAKAEAFRDAKPVDKHQTVADIAKLYTSQVMFDLRDEHGKFVGFYNDRVQSHANAEVLKTSDLIDDTDTCYGTLYIKY